MCVCVCVCVFYCTESLTPEEVAERDGITVEEIPKG